MGLIEAIEMVYCQQIVGWKLICILYMESKDIDRHRNVTKRMPKSRVFSRGPTLLSMLSLIINYHLSISARSMHVVTWYEWDIKCALKMNSSDWLRRHYQHRRDTGTRRQAITTQCLFPMNVRFLML